MPVEKQVLVIFAGSNGYLDDVPVNDIGRFEHDLLAFAEAHSGSLLAKIATKKALDDEIRNELKQLLTEFKERFGKEAPPTRAAAPPAPLPIPAAAAPAAK